MTELERISTTQCKHASLRLRSSSGCSRQFDFLVFGRQVPLRFGKGSAKFLFYSGAQFFSPHTVKELCSRITSCRVVLLLPSFSPKVDSGLSLLFPMEKNTRGKFYNFTVDCLFSYANTSRSLSCSRASFSSSAIRRPMYMSGPYRK
jgi:hypothetical protein